MRSRIMSTFVAVAAAGVTATTLGLAAAGAANAAVTTKAQPKHDRASHRLDHLGRVRGERAGLPLHQLDHHGPGHLVPDRRCTRRSTSSSPTGHSPSSRAAATSTCGPGIESCTVAQSFGYTCTTGTWVAYVEAFNNSLNGPYFSHYASWPG